MASHQPTFFSPQYRLFLGLSAFLLTLNLLLLNDWIEIQHPWEDFFYSHLALHKAWSDLPLPQMMVALFSSLTEGPIFIDRLFGTLGILLGGIMAYRWGKPIFGKIFLADAGLVLATSFVLICAAKFVVGDVWLLVFQFLGLLALLRFLKQPTWQWALGFWSMAILGLLTQPWSLAISLSTFGLYLRWLHPQGKVLDKLFFWLLPLVLFITAPVVEGFMFSYGNIPPLLFLGIILLSFLPWTGFFGAALADLIYKMRRREEMALILGGILLAGLLSQSLLLLAALALLTGRQLTAYFKPNYPYQSLARAGGVIHLLFSFLGITYFLITSFTDIGATGFRAMMAPGAIYWMFTFVGVIGLFGNQRRLILGGMAWGALVAIFLFWIQTYPVFFQ